MEGTNENRMLSDAELDTAAGGLSIVEPVWYAKARQMSEEFKKSHSPTLGAPLDLG